MVVRKVSGNSIRYLSGLWTKINYRVRTGQGKVREFRNILNKSGNLEHFWSIDFLKNYNTLL